ncbi:MAG TPA: DUF2125 domain-containing protein [Burkholderiales bacterium]|nr:DUF2125 domain-containing protein [Burkholderiales bacterium]
MSRSEAYTIRRRNRRYLALTLTVLLVSGAWIALWFYAQKTAAATIDDWRAREAKAGRVYDCGSQSMGGFPFRIEVTCDKASAVIRSANPPLEFKAPKFLVAAQIYQPTLLISEFAGPVTVAESGRAPNLVANWKLAQSSVSWLPRAPERVSLVFDYPVLTRANPDDLILRAKHLEIHGRMVEGSVSNHPVIEIAVQSEALTAPAAGPLAVPLTNVDIDGVLRGLKDFNPKPWPQRFREIQQAGGRIEIRSARLQQGDTVATGAGTVTINERGRLDGQINMAVAGLEAFINQVAASNQQKLGFNVTLGLGLLGGNTQVEGRRAISLPLRISDGVLLLGPFKVGEVPALF